MNNGKILFGVTLAIFLMSLAASSPLIISPSAITLTKTLGNNPQITFNITNPNPTGSMYASFYNIGPISNSYISFPTIPKLDSGQTAIIIANVTATSTFNGQIRIKGYYNASLGQTQATNYQANITNDITPAVDLCSFSLNLGDSITWNNKRSMDISIYNKANNNLIQNIPANGSYTLTIPQTLSYYYGLADYGSNECNINVLPTVGLTNNPDEDAILTLGITVNYPSANLSINYYNNTNFVVSPSSSVQGGITFTNTGNTTARNVTLSGQWFSYFNINNFDIAPGVSKNIFYTITPIVTDTSQTNQTYIIPLNIIDANSDQYSQNFNITIPYTNVNITQFQSNLTIDQLLTTYLTVVQAYCNDNPNGIISLSDGTIVACSQLFGSSGGSINTGNTSTDNLIKVVSTLINQDQQLQGQLKTSINNNTQTYLLILNVTNSTAQDVINNKQQIESLQNDFLIFLVLIAIGCLIWLAFFLKKKLDIKKMFSQGYHK